jgi:sec-independent protein translocase protein TatA
VFGLGPTEMMIIFVIILLVFGPSQLPKLARGLGSAMREFRKAQNEISDELHRDPSDKDKAASPHTSPESKPPDNKPIH